MCVGAGNDFPYTSAQEKAHTMAREEFGEMQARVATLIKSTYIMIRANWS